MLDVKIKKQLGSFCLNVDFAVENEVLALLGGSGSGKSMTLRAIAGILTPDEGRIIVDGEVFFDSEKGIDLPPQQRRVGLLFQNYALFPTMTVVQNIMTGVRSGSRKEKRAAALAAVERFQLTGLEHRYPAQLSGGQQQRVALARILVGKPRLLMLDEPFSALDSHLRDQMEWEVLHLIRAFSGTTLLVSHSRDEVFRMADRVAVYENGSINTMDTKLALFHSPGTYTAALLTGCKNFSAISGLESENGVTHCYANDWGLVFTLPGEQHGELLGVRGHHLRLGAAEGENCFPMEVTEVIESPFECVLLLRPEGRSTTPIRWTVSRKDYPTLEGMSRLLVEFPADALMLLRK